MSSPATTNTSRRSRRLGIVGAAAVALVLTAGCSTPSNTPESYGETNSDGVDIVQGNFLEGCVAAGDEAGSDNRADCQCIYDGIVEEIPFDEFEEIETNLENDPTDLPDRYVDIADRCVSGEVTAPSADTTTTAG